MFEEFGSEYFSWLRSLAGVNKLYLILHLIRKFIKDLDDFGNFLYQEKIRMLEEYLFSLTKSQFSEKLIIEQKQFLVIESC